jgi:SAM-dependent MidA family methyltransferase
MLEIDKNVKSSIINIQFQLKNEAGKSVSPEMSAPPEALSGAKGASALSRLSESQLWEIQSSYYKAHGVQDWGLEQTAPGFLTNTVFLGECYAELVIAFLNEHYGKINPSEPLYILELGTGSGRFAYQFLVELHQKLNHFEKLKALKVQYIMSDFSEKNCIFWENHPQLRPFIEKGLVDFAHYDPLKDASIELRLSKKRIQANEAVNPLIVCSNGFFDSIQQDAFQVSNQKLNEALVQLFLKEKQTESSLPAIDNIEMVTHYKEISSNQYYSESTYNAILKDYHEALSQKEGQHFFLFPIGALTALEQVKQLSSNGFLLFSSDRALTHLEANMMSEQLSNYLNGKTLSYCVNYDAISRYFTLNGGNTLLTHHDGWPLQTLCAYHLPETHRLEQVEYVFHNRFERLNMLNTLCCVPTHMNNTPEAHVAFWLSYMRTHLSEPAIFAHIGDVLLPQIAAFRPEQKKELMSLMEDAWKHFYYSSGENNTPFIFAKLYFALKEFEKCIIALEKTIFWFGDHAALRCFKGEAYAQLGLRDAAKAEFKRAVELEAGNEVALETLKKLEL